MLQTRVDLELEKKQKQWKIDTKLRIFILLSYTMLEIYYFAIKQSCQTTNSKY